MSELRAKQVFVKQCMDCIHEDEGDLDEELIYRCAKHHRLISDFHDCEDYE